MTSKESIEEAIEVFMSEYDKPHVELDWWLYDDENNCAFNIHNHGKKVDTFNVDVYPYMEGEDKPNFTKWNTMKTFSFKEYKNKEGKKHENI